MDQEQFSIYKELKVFFSPFKRRAILIIFTLGLLVFANGFVNGFLGDDPEQILNSPSTQSISNIADFFTTYLKNFDYYRPMFTIGLSAIYSIWGPSSFAFHLIQFLLHATTTVLLFFVLKTFFQEKLAFGLSLIFLIHPINSEVVYYISDLQDALFLFFGVSGLLLFIRAASTKHVVLSAFLFLLSVLSKEVGILFLPVVVVYCWFFKRQYFSKVMFYSIVVSTTYFLLRFNADPSNSGGVLWYSPFSKLSLSERVMNVPSIVFHYFKTFVYPVGLSVSHQWVHRSINFSYFYLPLISISLGIVAVLYSGFRLYKKKSHDHLKLFAVFTLWLVSGLLLHSQIIILTSATVADRWFYFPIVGLLGMIGVLIQEYRINLHSRKVTALFCIIIVLLSSRTFVRSFDWRNQLSISQHDSKVSDSHTLENSLSVLYLDLGMLEESKYHAEKSIELFPYYTNYLSLGNVYFEKKDYQNAEKHYLKGLEYGNPPQLYNQLALTYSQGDDMEKASSFIHKAIEVYPREGVLWFSLGIVEFKRGNLEAAKKALLKGYEYEKAKYITDFYNSIIENEK